MRTMAVYILKRIFFENVIEHTRRSNISFRLILNVFNTNLSKCCMKIFGIHCGNILIRSIFSIFIQIKHEFCSILFKFTQNTNFLFFFCVAVSRNIWQVIETSSVMVLTCFSCELLDGTA